MSRTAVPPQRTVPTTAFDRLRAAMAARSPLEPLDPIEYAVGHALFEARSDQREHLTDWLVRHAAARSGAPSRVLSIGCGDGTVDMRFAAALASAKHRVEYVGVEPYGPSGRSFMARLNTVPGVHASLLAEDFAQSRPEGSYDVVLAVHSLYYVGDLAATLRRARGLLARGGELVVLHAPQEPLNALVRLLSPGRRQGFSDEVVAQLMLLGRPQVERIDNRLDLTATGDPQTDRRLLAFTVQARMPIELQGLVRETLAERALPEPGLVLAHPVDAVVLRV